MTASAFTPKLITALNEGYNFARFRADLVAGLTVAIVALPLAMALGIASGASPREGLVTAVVGGALISLLGGSRVQIGGPTGAFVVIVAGVIAAHGYAGLVLATLLAGAILIVAGYSGVGRLMRFVPMPVVTGFTAGIAWIAYGGAFGTIRPATLSLGMATLVLIVALRRVLPRFPA